ncbi:histidine phosphatase superfamily [Aspergillus pseudotamarii]|uniref:Histidine phosphatase superfamily n=1 Tax=Aspergillus pseudotamarii TaxID=132259 RepID=A0A5N6SX14_ASPPS|nr:histidine phosphatase superfamily [Aspergillus pseudotamarii]KAE8139218.1 histidine phosphatase superfamily [Aspergillus pseudotamarii]
MAAQIYVVRHAESAHNVSKDFNHRDPPLTELGFQQASQLAQAFPYGPHVGVILVSPLRRAIQTTLAAFPHILDKRYFSPDSGQGIEDGAILIVDPDLQERSGFPCDTGSPRSLLEETFPYLPFDGLEDTWYVKEAAYSSENEAVEERAARVRHYIAHLLAKLKDQEKNTLIVLTHGVFMKSLVGDDRIDLPKAGWKAYTLKTREANYTFVPAEGL